jgi:uncharacterized protein
MKQGRFAAEHLSCPQAPFREPLPSTSRSQSRQVSALTKLVVQQDNVLGPVRLKERIQSLDVIRGVSILGILAVNADGFAAPTIASLNPSTWPFGNHGWTAFSYWVMDAFFHDKFVTLFSMLFGISLYLVGGERADKQKSKILWRRLVVLLLFAMLHGFGIWWGDILSLYAITGVPMLFCRSWRPRTLLFVGIVLYASLGVRHVTEISTLHPHRSDDNHAQVQATHKAAALAMRRDKVVTEITEARSSWAGAYRLNTFEYEHLLSGYPWLLPSTLGLMMIGLSLFKSGYLAGRSGVSRYVAMTVVGAISLGIVSWIAWRQDVVEMPVPATAAIELFLAPLVSLGYAAALILCLRSGAQFFMALFAAAGRMAFTNYLTQSIIMTSIFYGGRGALMGSLNRPTLWAIVVVMWILQLTWSWLWLQRFEMGPLEWVWRCLTYGRRVSFLKTVRSN